MVVIRGFVIPKDPSKETLLSDRNEESDVGASDSDDDSDDEDFENLDFGELNEIASGSYQSYLPSRARDTTLQLQLVSGDEQRVLSGQTRLVRGRFDPAFANPSWKIDLDVNDSKKGKLLFAVSSPSYSIRQDFGQDVMAFFLTSLESDRRLRNDPSSGWNQHVEIFLDFIGSNGLNFTLNDLIKNLVQFKNSGDVNSDIGNQIWTRISNTVPGKAFLVPTFTKHVHRLFPNQASKLLGSLSLKVLQELQQVLQTKPWVFGYKSVLKARYRILGCEANLKNFMDCGLLEKMDPIMKDALYLFDAATRITYQQGHTYVPWDELKHSRYYCHSYCPRGHVVTHWEEALEYLCNEDVLGKEDLQGIGRIVFFPLLRNYEEHIAESLSEIMSLDPWIVTGNLNVEVFGGDKDQIKACELIANSPVVVMSGKGGCGKTYVVSQMISMDNNQIPDHKDDDKPTQDGDFRQCSNVSSDEHCHGKKDLSSQSSAGQILLTAPTGKAASILGKRTAIQAYTLHHVIYSFYFFRTEVKRMREEGKSKEEIDAHSWKFSHVRVLVCDECSLISVKIFSTLLSILMKNAKLQQIILLGDCNQLPSIEPGNFLSDIYQSLEPFELSITLRTNHRSESELIVDNATRISQQKIPVFDSSKNFDSVDYSAPEMVELSLDEAVKTVLTKRKLQAQNSQIIAFRRKDCNNINELCSLHYNGHPTRDHRGKLFFKVEDKVCLGRNRTCYDLLNDEEIRLCNGEIFFIVDDITDETSKPKKRVLTLDDGERQIKIDFTELKKARMKHAWARTIHTYQGSETDAIVYVVGSPSFQNWQHVYTAVTRGKSQVFIISNQRNLETAIHTKPRKRYTRLKEFLEREASEPVRRLKDIGVASHQGRSTPEMGTMSSSISQFTDSELTVAQDPRFDITEFTEDSCVEAQVPKENSNLDISGNLLDEFGSSDDDELLMATQRMEQQFSQESTADEMGVALSGGISDDVVGPDTGDDWSNVRDDDDDDLILSQAAKEGEETYLRQTAQRTEEERVDGADLSEERYDGSQQCVYQDGFVITRNNLRSGRDKRQAVSSKSTRAVGCENIQDGASPGLSANFSQFCLSPGRSSDSIFPSPPITPDRTDNHYRSSTQPSPSRPGFLSSASPQSTHPQSVMSQKHTATCSQNPDGWQQRGCSPIGSLQTSRKRTTQARPPLPREDKRNCPSQSTPTKKLKRSFVAKFPGTCKICHASIRAGVDEICCLEQNLGKHWVHTKCAVVWTRDFV